MTRRCAYPPRTWRPCSVEPSRRGSGGERAPPPPPATVAVAGCCESGFEHLEGGVSGGFKRAAAAGLGPRTRHREAVRRATATRPRGARVAVAGHHGLCQKAAKGRARVHVRRSLRAAECSEWRSSPILARDPRKCSARAPLSGARDAANARVGGVARQGSMPRYSRKRL